MTFKRPFHGLHKVVCLGLSVAARIALAESGAAHACPQRPERYVPEPSPVSSDYYIAAHYCPLWCVKRNGYSMFTDITDMPDRTPLLGYYDEANPETADWQVKWALEHGIRCFVFCWYRSRNNVGRSIRGEEDLLLSHQFGAFEKARYGKMMDFAIMWECHNAGDAKDERDLVENLVPYWCEAYFRKPNYMKDGNRPVLFIYDFRLWLVERMGGADKLKKALSAASERAKRHGFDGIHFLVEDRSTDRQKLELLRSCGYEQSFAYCWHSTGRPTDATVIENQLNAMRVHVGHDPRFTVLTASQGWDPWPWERKKKTPEHRVDRWKLSPESWKSLLKETKKLADSLPADAFGRRFIMLDNWNEWAEGHYICPHHSGGFKYVQAVRDVFTKCDNLPDYRLPETLGLGPYDRTIDWAAPEVKWNEK